MFPSFEQLKTDEVCIYGTWGDYSVEILINSTGVEVVLPDNDKNDPDIVNTVKKMAIAEFINE